jgi:hypothetical protein
MRKTFSDGGNDAAAGMRILSETGEMRMIGKKVLGLVAAFVLLLVIASPVVADEKTIQLNIPGCSD